MLSYYITDRRQLPGDESSRRQRLLERLAAAAEAGVTFAQLREKDLPARALESLARAAVEHICNRRWSMQLLINSRVDVAIAVGAHGVHLPADGISASAARRIFNAAGVPHPLIAVSCHSVEEVERAREDGADFVVFGPVFEKSGIAGVGIERLREACSAAGKMPVLALGGVTLNNAADCLPAGAEGVAGIRLFQDGDLANTITKLRSLTSTDRGRPS